MKVAILGTRGIPNRYGGFEECAEKLSLYFTEKGIDTSVYSSSSHPIKETLWNGVKIIHKYDPEKYIGTPGQFIYDILCILDARRRNFDVILQLGYTSNSIWGWLLPKNSFVVTNMDGLEWKRSKYSKLARRFLVHAEKWGVETSNDLISDSIGIKNHLKEKYHSNSTFIPYGAEVPDEFDSSVLVEYDLKAGRYLVSVSRIEPENNVQTIIKGYLASEINIPLVIIGSINNKFSRKLQKKYESDMVRFIGGVYNRDKLNSLRHYSLIHFHGHSVGGTNPSLLEAMASKSLIAAHQNIFNKSILENNAIYFKTDEGVESMLKGFDYDNTNHDQFKINNLRKIQQIYNWSEAGNQYLKKIQEGNNKIKHGRFQVTSLYISKAENEASQQFLISRSKEGIPTYVCYANTHMAVEAYFDEDFAKNVNNATIVFADGYPIAKSIRSLYRLNQKRIAGMDYIPDLLGKLNKEYLSIFFLGSTDEVVDKAISRINNEYPNVKVVGKIIPPFNQNWDNESYIEQINETKPNFVIVSLGCPKQEKWMAEHSSRINSVLLGVGAAVPVFAGVLSRSPKWMRKNGFEWVYRLFQEPKRLFMRYFTSNFVFVFLFIKAFYKIRIKGYRRNTIISSN